jgi:hypothetical protein
MATTEQMPAYKTAFQKVLAAFAELQRTLGKSPRELRGDGALGEAVATASSAAHDGLRLVSQHERQLAGA